MAAALAVARREEMWAVAAALAVARRAAGPMAATVKVAEVECAVVAAAAATVFALAMVSVGFVANAAPDVLHASSRDHQIGAMSR